MRSAASLLLADRHLKQELARLKRDLQDDDRLADEQLPNGVDGPVARLRRK